MRGKIFYQDFNEKLGTTIIGKATPYGSFYGYCEIHPDDEDIKNAWDGAHFAEMKCDIKAMHEKAKWMRQRAVGAENALRTLDSININCRLDAYTLDMLERQVRAMYKEADKYKNIYEEMRDSYQAYTDYALKRRRELRNKIASNPED